MEGVSTVTAPGGLYSAVYGNDLGCRGEEMSVLIPAGDQLMYEASEPFQFLH